MTILEYLTQHRAATPEELSEATGIDAGTLGAQIGRMLRAGTIEYAGGYDIETGMFRYRRTR